VPLSSALLLVTLAAVLVTAILIACFGHVELTSRGRGVLRARDGVQPVIFETGGVIKEVLVHQGDVVRAGQPLLRLDSTQLRTALVQAERDLEGLRERTRRDEEATKKALLKDRKLLLRRAALTRKRIRSHAKSLADLTVQQGRFDELAREGLVAAQVSRERDQLLGQEQRGYLILNDELARIEQQVLALEQTYRAGVHEREHLVQQATARRDSAQLMLGQTELHAARDGRIESLLVSSGEVVQPGAVVARLVPVSRSQTVLAFVPERDRSFVRPGMEVRLELDQLPVGEFGSARARVVSVSSEIVLPAELERALGAAAPPGVHFGIELFLLEDPQTRRLTQHLGSGTLLSVRMPLRKRRLIALLFDPIREWLD
jgi:multidrug resistance efflux pump